MYLKPCKTTREASDYQEKRILQKLPPSFRQSLNSGATRVRKGDIFNNDWIIEAKTHMKENTSHSVKYGDLKELLKHGRAAGKRTAYIFDFGYDTPELYELILKPTAPPNTSTVPVFSDIGLKPSKTEHPQFRFNSHGVSFNREKIKAWFSANENEAFRIRSIIGDIVVSQFDPKNYM